ncbi:uncharacterized protein LOC119610530 [Lucilia sericata]|uniref:uncharacterized protein LOC119610530 n=1 Tax=Lucilia sericata TaxID=13632 RepID=UPI0018A876BF|nr:uncharacterized protein LOC119610530 [Lucilia sericata]
MGNERSNSSNVACSPPIPRVPTVQLTERSASEDNASSATAQTSVSSSSTSSSAVTSNKFRNSKSASAVMLTERAGVRRQVADNLVHSNICQHCVLETRNCRDQYHLHR